MSIKFNTNIPGWSCGIINKLGPFTLQRQQPNWWLIWGYHTHGVRTLSQHNPRAGISEILHTLRSSTSHKSSPVIECLFFVCQNLEFFIHYIKQVFLYISAKRNFNSSKYYKDPSLTRKKRYLGGFSLTVIKKCNLLLMTGREYGAKCFL